MKREAKVVFIDDLEKIAEQLKKEGKKIVTTNGSFDVLHVGHVRILEQAKKYGVLFVLINSDDSIQKLKGDSRPIIPEDERAEMLSYLACVDYVAIFDSDNPLKYINKIKPDYHVKGGTYVAERVQAEKELIESWGGQHIILPITEEKSTTNIINKINGRN